MFCDKQDAGRARVIMADDDPVKVDVQLLEMLSVYFKRLCAGCDKPEELECGAFIGLYGKDEAAMF